MKVKNCLCFKLRFKNGQRSHDEYKKKSVPELQGTEGKGSIPSTLPLRPRYLQENLISRPEAPGSGVRREKLMQGETIKNNVKTKNDAVLKHSFSLETLLFKVQSGSDVLYFISNDAIHQSAFYFYFFFHLSYKINNKTEV